MIPVFRRSLPDPDGNVSPHSTWDEGLPELGVRSVFGSATRFIIV
jgi:hypothetical protein